MYCVQNMNVCLLVTMSWFFYQTLIIEKSMSVTLFPRLIIYVIPKATFEYEMQVFIMKMISSVQADKVPIEFKCTFPITVSVLYN